MMMFGAVPEETEENVCVDERESMCFCKQTSTSSGVQHVRA